MSKNNSTTVASKIRTDIEKGVYRLHDRLPSERHLAQKYNVARNTLRESFLKLEESGYIKTKPSSGTYVTFDNLDYSNEIIENTSPLELIDTRFALEPHICRLSIMNGNRSQFQKLEECCRQMENTTHDPYAFSKLDTNFHQLLVETTGNKLLIWIISRINSVRKQEEWKRVRSITLNSQMISIYNEQHYEILDSIRSREPERAANAMKTHLESARLSLTRAVKT